MEATRQQSRLIKVLPVLAALLIASGIFGALETLISASEPGDVGSGGWLNVALNLLIAIISAISLVLLVFARRRSS